MVPELQNHNKSHAAHNTETLQDSCWKPANRKRGWFQTRTRHNWTGRILCRILIEKRLQHQEDMLLLHRFTKGFWQSLVQVKHGDPGRHHVKDCPSRSLEDGGRLGGEKTNWLTNKCPVQDLMTLAPEQARVAEPWRGLSQWESWNYMSIKFIPGQSWHYVWPFSLHDISYNFFQFGEFGT